MTKQRCRTTVAALAILAGCASTTTRSADAPAPGASTLMLTDAARRPHVSSLADLLDGRIAGLRVQRRAGGGIALELRGPGSAMWGEPLVVVDGDPFPDGAALGAFLSLVNPDDVLRVDVVKDPAGTAIYGPRGANGVVLITLRHGTR